MVVSLESSLQPLNMLSVALMELSQQYGTMICTRNNGSVSISKRPSLQPLSGELLSLRTCNQDDGAHLDTKASGCWGGWSQFSFRIFNPHALLNGIILTASMNERNTEHYEERVREIEHASFCPPLVYSTSGGMGPSTTVPLKHNVALERKKNC